MQAKTGKVPAAPSGWHLLTRRRGLEPRFLPYVFVAAAVIIVVVVNLFPLAFGVWDSLHLDSPLNPDRSFIGLQNYQRVLADPAYQNALANTAKYLLLTVCGVIGLGLVFALWLHNSRRRRGLWITVILIPWAVPGTVNGQIWSLIFLPTNGLLNGLLQGLQVTHTNVVWLQGPTALPLIALTLIWQTTPIATLILLAGLEYIPDHLYEQAKIDGASTLKAFMSITLPLLRPAIAIATVVASIAAIGIFDQIYVLNGQAAKTISVVQQTYLYAFTTLDFGLGISASLIAAVVSLVISLMVLKLVYREIEFG